VLPRGTDAGGGQGSTTAHASGTSVCSSMETSLSDQQSSRVEPRPTSGLLLREERTGCSVGRRSVTYAGVQSKRPSDQSGSGK